ncbi:MAG: SlyX family protein [Gammaproteobacteria bacterium]|nr:SlyX family protein [Gammaproteobacteria bacterium]
MSQVDINKLQSRIETLESQLAFQEDVIEQLNSEITNLNLNQQTMLRQITLLAEKVTSQKGSVVASESEETPPPHY